MNGYIEIVSGTLGGGKSMATVEFIYNWLKRGAYAFTNIEMHHEKVCAQMWQDGFIFEPERLKLLDGKTIKGFTSQISRGTNDCPVIVAIDEAHLEWNSRDYQETKKDKGSRDMLNFITMVRKLDIILYFITQSPEDIDKQLRKKAAYLTMCRNFKGFRIWNMIPFPFPIMTRTRWDISVGNPKPVRLEGHFFTRPKWVCEMYNSDALLGEEASKYSAMATAHGSPLARRQMPQNHVSLGQLSLVSLCAGFAASLF